MEVFRDFLAVNERSGGLLRIRVQRWSGGEPFYLAADDPTYTMHARLEPRARDHLAALRLHVAHDAGDDLRLRRAAAASGSCASASRCSATSIRRTTRASCCGRRRATASACRSRSCIARTRRIDGTAPLYLYAYGSYGLSADPVFSSARLSLLDRGFVYAIAHVRGGQERGRRWYEAGRLARKWNTFHDFIDVTDYPRGARLRGARARVRRRRQRRRAARRRDRQRRAGALSRAGRARAVRGHRHDHARRVDSAHDARIRGMGRSARAASTTNTCSPIRRTTMSAHRPTRRCW